MKHNIYIAVYSTESH